MELKGYEGLVLGWGYERQLETCERLLKVDLGSW